MHGFVIKGDILLWQHLAGPLLVMAFLMLSVQELATSSKSSSDDTF